MVKYMMVSLMMVGLVLAVPINDVDPNNPGPAQQTPKVGWDGLGDELFRFNINESVYAVGVEFFKDTFYVTAGQSDLAVLLYDINGTYVRQYPQQQTSGWGRRDLGWSEGWSGNEWLWGGSDASCEGFDPADGTIMKTINVSGGPSVTRAMGWDKNNQLFYTANFSSPIYEFDINGNVTNTGANSYSVYGAGYEDSSPDGPWVWISAQSPNNIYQFDPSTMSYTGVSFPAGGSYAGGVSCTTEYDPTKCVAVYLAQASPDQVIVYEIYSFSGVEEETQASRFSISVPTITKGMLNVNFNTRSNVELTVYNALGKMVKRTTANKPMVFDLTNLSNGIYFLEANNGTETSTTKFLIVH